MNTIEGLKEISQKEKAARLKYAMEHPEEFQPKAGQVVDGKLTIVAGHSMAETLRRVRHARHVHGPDAHINVLVDPRAAAMLDAAVKKRERKAAQVAARELERIQKERDLQNGVREFIHSQSYSAAPLDLSKEIDNGKGR